MSMEVIVTSDRKLVYNLLTGRKTTYFYREYNPFTSSTSRTSEYRVHHKHLVT